MHNKLVFASLKKQNDFSNPIMITEYDCQKLAHRLAKDAAQSGHSIAVAESCTGGWLAKLLTDIPASSSWFQGGIVAYSNEYKRQLLSVSAKSLEEFGAVSESVVQQMAQNLIDTTSATLGFAVSGIAGPENRPFKQRLKPIGQVCFAWAMKDNYLYSCTANFTGDRLSVRLQSVFYGLSGIHQLLRRNH